MNCPKCSKPLRLVQTKRPKLLIDSCPQCGGYWLDENELKPFITNKAMLAEFFSSGLKNPSASHHQCPRDKSQLFNGELPKFNTTVDVCPKCHGLWLDKGELQTIISKGATALKLEPTDRLQSRTDGPFGGMLDSGEETRWVGQPEYIPFLARGLPILIFGIIWGLFDLFFLINAQSIPKKPVGFPLIPFMLAHSFPFWIAVLNMARLILVHKNTWYAVTTRRLLLRTGFWGTDFRVIEFDQLGNMEVNINPVEYVYDCGSILFATGQNIEYQPRGRNNIKIFFTTLTDRFLSVTNPYEVFRLIKELSFNVRTDINYPNAYRPAENPGYPTKLKKSA